MSTILNQNDEDMCWSLYLSCVANPLSDAGSFEDFMRKYKAPDRKKETGHENGMDNRQIQKQLNKADSLLNGFVPPP